jgi:hypothetical protein
MSFFKFQLFASMSHGFQEAAKQQGGAGAAEVDEIKRMLMETKPWFLALTALVSILHMVYVDVTFWPPGSLKSRMLGLRYWRSSQMYPTGDRNVNSWECLSGRTQFAVLIFDFIRD